jgi:hypothetical protein
MTLAIEPPSLHRSIRAHHDEVIVFVSLTDSVSRAERSSEIVDSNGSPDAAAASRQLLLLYWRVRKHGCHTFRIDVEGQEYQRLVARVSPVVDEGVRFID